MKVTVLFHRLGPYHVARLKAVSTKVDLTVIELSEVTQEYAWDKVSIAGDCRRVTLFSGKDSRTVKPQLLKDRLYSVLTNTAPDVVVIHGWSDNAALHALKWCYDHSRPAVLMSESTEIDFTRLWIKESIKKKVIRLFSAALVGGSPHKKYLIKLGMPCENIFLGYDTVDNEYFLIESEKYRQAGLAIRQAEGLPDNFFLCSNRFIPKKNLATIIRAYARYSVLVYGNDPWHLVMLGDGPLRDELENLVVQLGIVHLVHFAGFRQYNELPKFYGLASCYVHASITEQWGLVVNEAMASGLPVLVSEHCGCAPDLVEEGRNGFTFAPNDVEALVNLMLKVSSGDCDRVAMGKASQEIISHWTPEAFARGLKQAVESALTSRPAKYGWMDKALLCALGRR